MNAILGWGQLAKGLVKERLKSFASKLMLLSLALLCSVAFTHTAFAAEKPAARSFVGGAPEVRPELTLSLLDQQIAAPIRQGGAPVVDLRGFTIDLRAEGLGDRFYQHLQKALNGSQPLGLDLSYTIVNGDLDLSRLSLRVPAYGGPPLPALEAFNQSFQPSLAKGVTASMPSAGVLLSPSLDPVLNATTGSLARSLLIQPQAVSLDTLVIQGPLLLSQTCFNGLVNAADLYFLSRVEAQGAIFTQRTDWHGARFARSAIFSLSQFQQESSFRSALFASRSRFNQVSFNGPASWQGSTFYQSASFAQADFHGLNFARSHWQTNADFDQATFHSPTTFQKSRFDQALFLSDAQFESAINFRQAQFQQPISLRGARVLSQLDFGDARFAKTATINVADLDFNAGEAKILGSPGQIGKVFVVPTLASNETVLRNLVLNFRLLEQISDANQLEYTTERLRLAQIKRQIFGVSLNQASAYQLVNLGLSAEQAAAVVARAQVQPFVSRADLLGLDEIDLASYLKVRDRLTTKPTDLFTRLGQLIHWLLLAGLLLLSQYGTNVGLIFSLGLIATTLFALLFWLVDRYRRRLPTPIVPTRAETTAMALGSAGLMALALSILTQSSDRPLQALAALGFTVLPVPLVLTARLYQQGRYHDLMTLSYFVENGALRKLQVLIARLPIVPNYPFYRDRYTPLLMDKRWNWLNYFDLSLNNWLKFGFNDVRLREKSVPGLVSALVWYQWSLGIVYITLMLWTLSRTIPGLNLLLYF